MVAELGLAGGGGETLLTRLGLGEMETGELGGGEILVTELGLGSEEIVVTELGEMRQGEVLAMALEGMVLLSVVWLGDGFTSGERPCAHREGLNPLSVWQYSTHLEIWSLEDILYTHTQ